jgi:hypothetical protein
MIKSRIRWAGCVARMGELKITSTVSGEKPEETNWET